ncbi:hypothetical protein K2X30_08070 [bacterium]|jgi:hypothetical protein|nr:hypothetical protein [bacterium]
MNKVILISMSVLVAIGLGQSPSAWSKTGSKRTPAAWVKEEKVCKAYIRKVTGGKKETSKLKAKLKKDKRYQSCQKTLRRGELARSGSYEAKEGPAARLVTPEKKGKLRLPASTVKSAPIEEEPVVVMDDSVVQPTEDQAPGEAIDTVDLNSPDPQH